MKFIHLADLHIGKRVNGFSMLEDQEYIFDKILEVAKEEKPDAVLIAGDLYDKTIPAAEAVKLCDSFLVRLSKLGARVLVISGNHDSAQRVAFGSRLMEESGVYIAPVYDGKVNCVTLEDCFGPVNVYMMPFIKPSDVKCFAEEESEELKDFHSAVKYVVSHISLNRSERNIAMVHQFITGSSICDSEERSVGGLDNVDQGVFDDFDYVALGHLHGPQSIGRETMRYAGSPLKYSFSELNQSKSLTVVEMGEKGKCQVRLIPLVPRHEMHRIRGTFDEITAVEFYSSQKTDDYFHIILTDEEDVRSAGERLRRIYPNWMVLEYDNTRTRTVSDVEGAVAIKEKSPVEIFAELFEAQNGQPMKDDQLALLNKLIHSLQDTKEG